MNMNMLEIAALANGAHRNQTFHGILPDGWAVVPEDMELENFPFGEVTAEEITHYRDVEVMRDVVKTREVESVNENGETVTTAEEYTEQEWVTEQEPYGVMTVTGWKPLPTPEVKPEEPMPTQLDIIEAQVTYTAMMTDTLLEV
jgi:hypothetical protein